MLKGKQCEYGHSWCLCSSVFVTARGEAQGEEGARWEIRGVGQIDGQDREEAGGDVSTGAGGP